MRLVSFARVYSTLKEIIQQESENTIPWIPVFLSLGVVIYFNTNIQASNLYLLCLAVINAKLALIFRKSTPVVAFFSVSFLIIAGYALTSFKVSRLDNPLIKKRIGPTTITGLVTQISRNGNSQTIILSKLKLDSVSSKKLPKRIRIKNYHLNKEISLNDKIQFTGVLRPLPLPSTPGGFDFSRNLYFKEIGGVGYSIEQPKVIDKLSTKRAATITEIREYIKEKLSENLGNRLGQIAQAMLLGKDQPINNEIYYNWQVSGIAHLLAISGIHMVIVVGFMFLFARYLICYASSLSLYINSKKYAACIGLIGGICYLILSNAPISAQRAFTMSAVVLLAVLLDRNAFPLRSLSIAAILIICITPEAIISPSMQMSFAACLGLLSVLPLLSGLIVKAKEYSLVLRIPLYALSVIFATLISTISTMPFALYHFHQLSSYGLLTNLIAIPIHEFIVMPSGVISVLLMPIGLEFITLQVMGAGLAIMDFIAYYAATLPASYMHINSITPSSLCLLAYGGVILAIARSKVKFLGIILILSGLVVVIYNNPPDIAISEDGKIVTLRKQNGGNFSFGQTRSLLLKQVWEQTYGNLANMQSNYKDKLFSCTKNYCSYYKAGIKVYLVFSPKYLSRACSLGPDLLINLSDKKSKCKKANNTLSILDFKKRGSHEIYLKGDTLKVTSVKGSLITKPWHRR